ncbi:MAG: HlyD family efflux transporter periplasmic adaptor subunit [Bacteroidaceae bacterium]|nr:HlyD family efflux transporter periplasmic adaptor subunit [Bacteroidaceae bacterium]
MKSQIKSLFASVSTPSLVGRAGVGLLLLTLASCGNKDADYDASGVFETTEVLVSARGTGEIVSLNIVEGQQVKANEELGRLDMTQLVLKKEQLGASKLQVQANKTATNSHVLDLEKQVASIRQQIANLQREKNRFSALLKDGAATRKQVDDISYQISVLQKQLSATQEQINASNKSFKGQSAGLDAQSSGVDAQMSAVDDQMRQAVITSPIDGVILSKYAEQGEFAAPGRALFKVADVSQMRLRAYITADLLTNVKIGQKVKVYADQGDKGRKEYEGTVSWISSEAEFTPKTIQTRNERSNLVYAVKIDVKNDGIIKRGMYGDVKL